MFLISITNVSFFNLLSLSQLLIVTTNVSHFNILLLRQLLIITTIHFFNLL